jgi:hypothetical protein
MSFALHCYEFHGAGVYKGCEERRGKALKTEDGTQRTEIGGRMPEVGRKRDERPTSNIEHRTSNVE